MTGLRSIVRGSRFVRAASDVCDRLRVAMATAGVARGVRGLARLPATAKAAAGTDERSAAGRARRARPVLRGSTAAGALRRLETRIGAASRASTITHLFGAVRAYVRGAWLYRWLTSEPDPEVVVIDLRQTWSVGPPLAVLDRAVDAIVPGLEGATVVRTLEGVVDAVRRRPIARTSAIVLGVVLSSLLASIASGDPSRRLLSVQIVLATVATLGLRSHTTLHDLRTTRTARLLVAAFEPPDPPTEHAPLGPNANRAEDEERSAEGSGNEEPDGRSDRTNGEKHREGNTPDGEGERGGR